MHTTRLWLATLAMKSSRRSLTSDVWPPMIVVSDAALGRLTEKPAFRCVSQTLSYVEIGRQPRTFAAWLKNKQGIKKGDRITMIPPNRRAFPVVLLGIRLASAVQIIQWITCSMSNITGQKSQIFEPVWQAAFSGGMAASRSAGSDSSYPTTI